MLCKRRWKANTVYFSPVNGCKLVPCPWREGERGSQSSSPRERQDLHCAFPPFAAPLQGAGVGPHPAVPCTLVPWYPSAGAQHRGPRPPLAEQTACSPPCFSKPWPRACHELRQQLPTAELEVGFKPHACPAREGHGAALRCYQPSSPPASRCVPPLWHLQAPAKSATSSSRRNTLSRS